jgi:DNA-binding LacI/PurR family transcriptional regulator
MRKKTDKKINSTATIYDVARKADVSVVTVSRAFNDYPHVSDRMKTRVMEAARQVGFSPKLVARPRRLAVIIGHMDHLRGGGYKEHLLLRLIGSAARQGYSIEFIPADEIELVIQRSVDGVIEFGLTSREVECLNRLAGIPTVLINKETPNPEQWSTVCSDHFMEARLATEYLIKRGHKRITLVLDEYAGWSAEQRQSGYSKAMKKGLGKTCDLSVLAAAGQSVEKLAELVLENRSTGLINLSDNVGLSLTGYLNQTCKIKVPDDMSVIALENDSVTPFLSPPLTTIDQPLLSIAETAVSELIATIRNGKKTFHHKLKSRLIERDSVNSI